MYLKFTILNKNVIIMSYEKNMNQIIYEQKYIVMFLTGINIFW